MHAIANQTSRTVSDRSVRRGRRRTWAAVPIAMGALALTAACTPYGTSTAASSASAPTSLPAGTVVGPATTGLGTILVNADGRTVYEFANDTAGRSTCTGACSSTWLPVAASDAPPATLPGVTAPVGSTPRSDGTHQLTVGGHPVYTFTGDNARGQTHGQGITLNGGLWSVLTPKGTPLAAGSLSSATGY